MTHFPGLLAAAMSPVSIAVFAGVFVPTFVAVAVWAVVTALRVLREPAPELHDLMPEANPDRIPRLGVRVGAREIRADLRHRERHGRTPAYRFEKGVGSGLPPMWMQDAARRRN